MGNFEDIKNKFVLVNTEDGLIIIIARCIFHKDLVWDIENENVYGGGEWEFNRETGKLKLFGESNDFGFCNIENIQPVLEKGDLFTRPGSDFQLKEDIKEIEFVESYPYKTLNLKFENGKGKILQNG